MCRKKVFFNVWALYAISEWKFRISILFFNTFHYNNLFGLLWPLVTYLPRQFLWMGANIPKNLNTQLIKTLNQAMIHNSYFRMLARFLEHDWLIRGVRQWKLVVLSLSLSPLLVPPDTPFNLATQPYCQLGMP